MKIHIFKKLPFFYLKPCIGHVLYLYLTSDEHSSKALILEILIN